MIVKKLLIFVIAGFSLLSFSLVLAQNEKLLSSEEVLWLQSRNNTVIVYPEKNNPPFSYTSAGGNIQGLAIDYMELVAEKVGAKIQYLSPQSRNQILQEFTEGKGDVVPGLVETNGAKLTFLYTDPYIEVPTVIVVRKDVEGKTGLNMPDFNGKKVSVVAGSALEAYVRQNYPRVVVEDVTDDEVSLQQIVLGEVDAGIMDVASLSYFLSKQVLNSVKIAGNVGYEYKPSFAVSADKPLLQSIIEKGFSQITANERQVLNDKWVVVPGGEKKDDSLLAKIERSVNLELLYIIFGLGVLLVIMFMFRYAHPRTKDDLKEEIAALKLKEEVEDLEDVNKKLVEELKEMKEQDKIIAEKLESLTKPTPPAPPANQ